MARLPDRGEIESARAIVRRSVAPTPQHEWPLLARRLGARVLVKHENHTVVGAFKVRGGLVWFVSRAREGRRPAGVVSATRGNHGQSVAFAARAHSIPATIVVPHGNSREKNAAMRALGVELVEHGHDFQASAEFAAGLAEERRLHFVRSFDDRLVLGVASYAIELLRGVADLDTVYVPIGMGSGICGMIAAREALGLKTKIVGVVASGAPAYALSFAAGKPVSTNGAETMADGLACRAPSEEAVAAICRGAERIVTVSDDEIRAAMRHLFTDTHNLAEGAGAATLAALLQEKVKMAGKRVAIILSGGNIDRALYAEVLAEA
jgi:threonine dehydratase